MTRNFTYLSVNIGFFLQIRRASAYTSLVPGPKRTRVRVSRRGDNRTKNSAPPRHRACSWQPGGCEGKCLPDYRRVCPNRGSRRTGGNCRSIEPLRTIIGLEAQVNIGMIVRAIAALPRRLDPVARPCAPHGNLLFMRATRRPLSATAARRLEAKVRLTPRAKETQIWEAKCLSTPPIRKKPGWWLCGETASRISTLKVLRASN